MIFIGLPFRSFFAERCCSFMKTLIICTVGLWNFCQAQVFPLKSPDELKPLNVKVESVQYRGRDAVRVTGEGDGLQIAEVKGSSLLNGTIEVDVAGKPLPGANPGARGFVGIAFRVEISDSARYECFYLRPTNARAEDQLRRNHSTQYISVPGFPWHRLRRENPGLYESYADMVPGEWTKIKIVIRDKDARLFVNNSDQPCLIVKDLKQGETKGAIALWIGLGTEAFFSDLTVVKE